MAEGLALVEGTMRAAVQGAGSFPETGDYQWKQYLSVIWKVYACGNCWF